MAGPKPRATPATVVEVADEGGVVILSDDPVNSLTVDDLPMGVLKDANKQTAAHIVEMFKEKAPVDQGQHARHLLTQLATRFGKLQRTVDKQQETIRKLVEERQQSLTGHNQDASQTADYDEEMEKWARYYGYGDEDED
ncbi:hypothetical protein FPRO06_08633 [Fusarium proliferatum]|uniref:Uncharacterized protein n=1 Tax=Gibberella intermedia TaxID=948311 RepID=A0A365ND52_GIBIN|nr:hypothetical protein FPRO06_08633 [Fusarium proliferatum]RBA18741.1 hypothetical protein FPRO05_10389 [Fusarium proliferatum]